MREKWIDLKYKSYFEFGEHENGKVDLNNGDDDICTVTKSEAETLIKDRDEILKLIHLINEKYPKEFDECFNDCNDEQLEKPAASDISKDASWENLLKQAGGKRPEGLVRGYMRHSQK